MATRRSFDTELPRTTRVVVMSCDAPGCLRQVRRAPRIIIPSRTPFDPTHRPIRVMTTLHCCDAHRDIFDPREWLTDQRKADVERVACARRPAGFRPDFEDVRVELVLVTTPEYRRFLADVLGGSTHVVA
jgi:hypothetical protein